jgi:AcrR family transcriptional regulator
MLIQDEEQPVSARERQKLLNRRRLLEAAREEFARSGYTGATVEDIAARAGVSRATLYMHFESKLDLLAQIGEALRPEVRDYYLRLDAALASRSRDDLRCWMEYALRWYQRYAGLMPAWEQATALEPSFKERAKTTNWHLPDVMTSYLERWPPDQREHARARIVLLAAQLQRLFSIRPAEDWSEAEYEVYLDVLTELWYPALQPHTTPAAHSAPPD